YFDPGVFVLVSSSDPQTFTTVAVGDVALASLGHDYLNTTVEVETVACLGRHVAYPLVDFRNSVTHYATRKLSESARAFSPFHVATIHAWRYKEKAPRVAGPYLHM
ncbi:MAG TPA: hypothetical protein QF409_02125, partial [Acidimicrobiales bacterium]|nr:hypothetical protein [Acidimicrobiales bacterium]